MNGRVPLVRVADVSLISMEINMWRINNHIGTISRDDLRRIIGNTDQLL